MDLGVLRVFRYYLLRACAQARKRIAASTANAADEQTINIYNQQ